MNVHAKNIDSCPGIELKIYVRAEGKNLAGGRCRMDLRNPIEADNMIASGAVDIYEGTELAFYRLADLNFKLGSRLMGTARGLYLRRLAKTLFDAADAGDSE